MQRDDQMRRSYPYRGDHMIATPQHYMYSEFQGMSLLQAWKDDRNSVLQATGFSESGARHWLVTTSGAEISADMERLLTEGPGNSPIATRSLLDALCAKVLNSGITDVRWTDMFRRKFEVFKRLYDGYDIDLKVNGPLSTSSVYTRLGFLLASTYDLENDIPILNCLLKINDFIASMPVDLFEQVDKAYSAISVSREIDAVYSVCGAHSVDMSSLENGREGTS